MEPLWTLRLPLAQERVVAAAARPDGDALHAVGEILLDRSVMYKYLSPHLLGVATLAGEGAKEGARLAVYVIDTIKGNIVERVEHEHVQGPVSLVHAENWFAYTYRDRKHRRPLLSVLELFDAAGKPPPAALSALRMARPIVVAQSFVLPAAISRMGVTVTDAGVAFRALIAALPSGRLAAITERFFDPRRPTAKAPRSEEQVPYHPLLPLDTTTLLNYNRSVARPDAIVCAPTALESTSLAFVHGLDLFLTHVAPSKRFDVLSADFNKPMLLASIAALALAVVVAARRAASNTLRAAWA